MRLPSCFTNRSRSRMCSGNRPRARLATRSSAHFCGCRCGRIRLRRGITLVEQTVIISLLGILAALAVQSIGRQLDRIAVRSAAREARDVFATAREFAVARGVRTAVQIDPLSAELSAHASGDTLLRRPLGTLHNVTLSTSRDSMAYSPSGLGYGASNLRIIVVKHAAAETVTVSRLGRVR